jgi:hypothetical protein
MGPARRRTLLGLLRLLTLAAALSLVTLVLADAVPVPIGLQAELMAKIAAYDANLRARAGGKIKVRILTIGGDATSKGVAADLTSALAAMPTIAGLPHEEATATFTDPSAVAQGCAADHVSILYLAPGLSAEQMSALAKALEGADLMTVAAEPRMVPLGAVLGFDLVAGKPKLLVHLTQARRQHVELSSNVLELMKVFK